MRSNDTVGEGIKQARKWESKGETSWAYRNYASALLGQLSSAVTEHEDASEGIDYLTAAGAQGTLAKCRELSSQLFAALRDGRTSASTIGGNYQLLVLGHVSWLLGSDEDHFVVCAAHKDIQAISTRFWREYCRAITCLVERQRYEPTPPPRLAGMERYWAVYLEVIKEITHDGGGYDSWPATDEAFVKRNRDRRCANDDVYGVEGSAHLPARWDYRMESLARYVKARG
jgi:hypothetical protein